MSSDPDLFSLDELPDDVRAVLDEAEQAVATVRSRADRQAAAIREQAERECAEIRARAETEVSAVQQEATRELAPLVRELVDRLRRLQETYAREGKLDEALAIRARVRQLRGDLLGVRPDPGSMSEFGQAEFGRTFLFEVVGRTDGSVWGTDIYTADSRLAPAAVHAGAVRDGERGLVRVTILDGTTQGYEGTTRNGVQTLDYATYPTAYRVERV
ncbi:MAG TPA: LCCL domain-containing protein [Gemmataceae bacterium]|nr:LCCL domain-containing protein [Gemmataceae bacterium]